MTVATELEPRFVSEIALAEGSVIAAFGYCDCRKRLTRTVRNENAVAWHSTWTQNLTKVSRIIRGRRQQRQRKLTL